MKVKICGLTQIDHVKTCVENGADFCGFILNYPKSHRYITFKTISEFSRLDKKKSKFVAVLVNPSEKELNKFSKLNIDYFQLYGKYDNGLIAHIKKKFSKKIITTIQVKSQKDVDSYVNIEKESDIILWDSSGLEKSLSWNFDWIKSVKTNKEKMLAGNIDINNLKKLSNLTDIVDVSGALETNKVKDIDKIKKFINEINKINHEN
tara:strand:+ start:3070 stop:3687 length:618 start_codon:yes stop_codon:yes gene_type:complete